MIRESLEHAVNGACCNVIQADCLQEMTAWPASSIDAIVTDPPYGLNFMGKAWDHGVPGVPYWQEALRVAKPGAYLAAFGGTRTSHRLACAIEDAGWEIRDTLSWMYGQGFPKSLDVSKAIDKAGAADGEALQRFRAAITHAREAKGLSRSEVSTAVVGSASGAVWNWETGLRVPTGEHWNQMVRVLDLSADFTGLRDAAEREIIAARRGNTKTFDVGADEVVGPRPPVTAPATDAAKQWVGYGTALKPAWEPIILARKPLIGTVAANVLAHGTGGINIDGCRVGTESVSTHSRGTNGAFPKRPGETSPEESGRVSDQREGLQVGVARSGRWPANVILGCACETEHEPDCAVRLLDEQTVGVLHNAGSATKSTPGNQGHGAFSASAYGHSGRSGRIGDSGTSASRFFYCAKASRSERTHGGLVENVHPTVKPVSLMRWLVRLITPPEGIVLDLFCGSGSTLVSAVQEGFDCVGIEIEGASAATALARCRSICQEV